MKVHKRYSKDMPYYTRCHRHIAGARNARFTMNMADDWDKVTCKGCLKAKPKT